MTYYFLNRTKNKIVQAEELKTELESKINEMVRKNKTRERFMVRLTKMLDDYNHGSITIDELLNNLVDLAKDLSVEEVRAITENLNEYELAQRFSAVISFGELPDLLWAVRVSNPRHPRCKRGALPLS